MTDNTATLSRVADSLYWMSRYLERAENTARALDVYLNLMLDIAPGTAEQHRLQRLQQSLAVASSGIDGEDNADDLLYHLTFDEDAPIAIRSAIRQARENARWVREQISSEMWTQMNTLYLHVRRKDAVNEWRDSPHEFYMQVREGSYLFQGITDATMNHNQGWHFIQLGRYLERGFNLLRLLDAHFRDSKLDSSKREAVSTSGYFDLVATLKSVSSFEAYCRVYNPNLNTSWIVEFLLFNQGLPHSLRFCVEMIQQSLNALGDMTRRGTNNRLSKLAGRLQANLSYDEIDEIDDLHEYLMNVERQFVEIHDTLYKTFISYPIESAL